MVRSNTKTRREAICVTCEKSFIAVTSPTTKKFNINCSRACKTIYTRKQRRETLVTRFWERVHKPEGWETSDACWPWTAGKSADGYGQLGFEGKVLYAHRFSFELHHGPLVEGSDVLHRCDNPPCVRPDHISQGLRQANVDDMMQKGRQQDYRKREEQKKKKRLVA